MSQALTNRNNPRAALVVQTKIADEGELGPAMQALPTDRQRKFVIAMLQRGGRQYGVCAGEAGYEGTPQSLKTIGHRLANDARVQEAIREEGQRMLGASVGIATGFLIETIENPVASAKDRLRAAEMLLNRTGLPAMTEHKVTVEHKLTEDEKLRRIEELADKFGLDKGKLLGDIPYAEFTEVEEHSTEGLEDVLGI